MKPKVVQEESTHEQHHERVLFEERFTGFRLKVREACLPWVYSGTDTIIDIQQGKGPWKTVFWNAMSIVGSHDFFLAFFPILIFGVGCTDIANQMIQRAAMGIYVGNWIKDYLCLPRPPCPPVTQLNGAGNKEFGLPSTHAVTAVCLPFFTLFSFLSVNLEITFLVAFCFALIYMYLIAYSRLYLGMHSPADVISGLAVGLFILIGGFVVEYLIEMYELALPAIPVSIFVLYGIILLLHPEPHGPCPCFEDSACFLGSAAGYLAGSARCADTNTVVNMTPALFIGRWLVGCSILFIGRAVYKPFMRKVVYTMWDNMKLPRQSFVYPQDSKTSDAKPFPSPKWDINVLIKYIIYYTIVEHCLEFTAPIITMLSWW